MCDIYIFTRRWGNVEFPLPFGRVMSATESFIHGLDEKVTHLTYLHFYIFNNYQKCLNMDIVCRQVHL